MIVLHIKKPCLKAMLIIALLAASASQVNSVVAESAPLSTKDMLDQAVALYEKLSDKTVSVPEHLSEYETEDYILKSVVLGYINLDETLSPELSEYTRKQDVMTLLYKTVINYDDSYTISEEEASQILNSCYDNAIIDEENRIAYAFMIKHGIINSTVDTEPNKNITWDSCRILVDIVYDYFVKEITFTIDDVPVTMGSHFSSLPDSFSNPDRIDLSDYGFDWYVYNSNYENFCMIGVENDRICGFYTNAKEFSINSIIYKNDNVDEAQELLQTNNITLYANADDEIDSVLYTSRCNGYESNDKYAQARTTQLLDMINARRLQDGCEPYVLDGDLSNSAWMTTLETMQSQAESDASFIGFDIFVLYNKLISDRSPIIFDDSSVNKSIGIDTTVDGGVVYASIITGDSVELQPDIVFDNETSENNAETENVKSFTLFPTVNATDSFSLLDTHFGDNQEAPQLLNPETGKIPNGENIVLDLKKPVSDQYLLEVYNLEKATLDVNSYITTREDDIEIPSDVLTNGSEYEITLSSVGENDELVGSDSIKVCYGDPNAADVKLITESHQTDNDYIALEWTSEQFSEFYVDVYNTNGELIVSQIIEDETEAMIQGLDPDTYYIYVTALRKGTTMERAQDSIEVEIKLPEPVINEYILNPEDKYYFVYEDEELGVLYFYDEEIIDVEEDGKTVKKKKIIQKQVKSTKAYRTLAEYQVRHEYVTGEPTLRSAYNATGDAIVSEAKKYLGIPYVWGGTSPKGFDCSGLVQYVCKTLGITVDRVTYDQVYNGVKVEREDLAPGDLIFFQNSAGSIHHVGIYVGDNQFLHAPHTGDVVKISSLTGYYSNTYYQARRVY